MEPVSGDNLNSNGAHESMVLPRKSNDESSGDGRAGDQMEVDREVKKSKRKTLKDIRKAAAANLEGVKGGSTKSPLVLTATTATALLSGGEMLNQSETEFTQEAEWGGIKLHILLYRALISLNFNLPTPIQIAAIPALATGKCDLVGAAETGSGEIICTCDGSEVLQSSYYFIF